MKNTFVLFTARHDVPNNSGALCELFDFTTFKAIKTANWQIALELIKADKSVAIIVTGLTPALTEFISDCYQAALYTTRDAAIGGQWYGDATFQGHLSLLHYNKDTMSYVKQVIF
jgi:hypothetical protein